MTDSEGAQAPDAFERRLLGTWGTLGRNTLLNLLGQGISLLAAVLTIPAIVRYLGTDRFGFLALTWVIVGYFAAFDLGLGRALTRAIAEALPTGNSRHVRTLTWTAIAIQFGLGCASAILVFLLAPFFVSHIPGLSRTLRPEATTSLQLLATATPALLLAMSMRGILEAFQRFDLLNLVSVPAAVTLYVIPLFGSLLHWRLSPIVALISVSRWIVLLAYFVSLRRVDPTLRHPTRPGIHIARTLLSYGLWVTVSNLAVPVLIYFDRIALALVLGVTAIAYYSAAYEIVTRLRVLPANFVATLFPAFSEISRDEDSETVRQLSLRGMSLVLHAVLPLALCVTVFGRELLRVWLGSEFANEASQTLRLLTIGILVNSIGYVPYVLIQGLGHPDWTAKLHAAEVPVHIGTTLVLGLKYGVGGVAVAWCIRVFIDTLVLLYLAGKLSGMAVAAQLREIRVLRAALLLGCAWTLSSLGENHFSFIIRGGYVLAGSSAISLWLWRRWLLPSERTTIRQAIRRIRPVRQGNVCTSGRNEDSSR